jgi:RNA-directed DNA polymerase
MQTRTDVAGVLEVTDSHLRGVLYGLRKRENYREFEIPKRAGGTRTISAPPFAILNLQRRLYVLLSDRYDRKKCVHGFVRDQSIVSNAEVHSCRRYVVNFDLRDFFHSIHIGRVRGVFCNEPFNFGLEAATVLAQICCRGDGLLPQGGVMSPLISNLVCRSLDNDLMRLARRTKVSYTRYADDLTFSTQRSTFPSEIVSPIPHSTVPGDELRELVESHKFELNTQKGTRRSRRERQEVTGLTVNEFPNVVRARIRQIERAIYAWARFGYDKASHFFLKECKGEDRIDADLESVLRGRLAFLSMVRGKNDCLFRKLARRFNRLSERPVDVVQLESLSPCRLKASIPRRRGWELWRERYEKSVVHVGIAQGTSEEASGTAFHINHGVFATAGHNLVREDDEMYSPVEILGADHDLAVVETKSPWNHGDGPDVGAISVSTEESIEPLPTQYRLPEVGESVAALGYPRIPCRDATHVLHTGAVEALPVCYRTGQRFIQVSFQSGGGMSGGCLIDRAGYVLGIMVENVFMKQGEGVPSKAYGQAIPIECFDDAFPELWVNGQMNSDRERSPSNRVL